MARLIYSSITSLDGYVVDASGSFDWAMPDDEVHAFLNDLERPIGTYLYGRRMYDTMAAWETVETTGDGPIHDYARIWQSADKIVYSRTSERITTSKTRIEREFKPEAVRRLKASATRDISVGGAELAGQALRAGLVDECHLVLAAIVVGGGRRSLPDGVRIPLELIHERRFASGAVHLHYAVGNRP